MNKKQYEEIFIEEEESLVDIIDKIKNTSGKYVAFDIDTANKLLENEQNFKILLFKFPDKRFALSHANQKTRDCAYLYGISLVGKNEHNVVKNNYTPSEYCIYTWKHFVYSFCVFFTTKRYRFFVFQHFPSPLAVFVIIGLILVGGIIFFVFHLSIAKVIIHITPEQHVKHLSQNIVFEEQKQGKYSIPVERRVYTHTFRHTYPITTPDKRSLGIAQGEITLFNWSSDEIGLRPSRFVTEKGLQFHSSEWAGVPPVKIQDGKKIPGTIDILLKAGTDSSGRPLGSQGNISKNTLLFLPALEESSAKILEARAKNNFSGGKDPNTYILTQEELDNQKELFIETIKIRALESAKTKLDEENINTGTSYSIVDRTKAPSIIHDMMDIRLLEGKKIGDAGDTFSLEADIQTTIFIYNEQTLRLLLKEQLLKNMLFEKEKLVHINYDSLQMTHVFPSNSNTPQTGFYLKVTLQFDIVKVYQFEEASQDLFHTMRQKIRGIPIKEAQSLLLNDTNIARVSIHSSPFWLNSIPNVSENISFFIEDIK